eukprot:TRINITY_DN67046_c5_g1_i3.p1 TRINITY_DN67046_c5_g1~~TRINITY_DN67046_c5_g1_i3.p1  ORF type:complete len:162 (+),score=6.71 TRINITY_DN67046_c5_g1_i3:240-725(+)
MSHPVTTIIMFMLFIMFLIRNKMGTTLVHGGAHLINPPLPPTKKRGIIPLTPNSYKLSLKQQGGRDKQTNHRKPTYIHTQFGLCGGAILHFVESLTHSSCLSPLPPSLPLTFKTTSPPPLSFVDGDLPKINQITNKTQQPTQKGKSKNKQTNQPPNQAGTN